VNKTGKAKKKRKKGRGRKELLVVNEDPGSKGMMFADPSGSHPFGVGREEPGKYCKGRGVGGVEKGGTLVKNDTKPTSVVND